MKKCILITLVIIIFFTFLNLLTNYRPIVTNSKKLETKLVTQKRVAVKINTIKKKSLAIKEKVEEVNILISYYSNSTEDCGKTDAISASGKNLNRSGNLTYVAAPKNISFGTKIDVDKIGVCQVEDRGGAIQYVSLSNN